MSVVSRRSSSAPLMKFWSRSVCVALEVGRRQVAVGRGGGHLGAGRVGGQPVVLRVELRQHLAGLHVLAELGLALR